MLEGSCATVGVLLKNGDFVVPPFTKILPGTTAIKIMDFIEKQVIPFKMLPEGYIRKIVRREIAIKEA